MERRVKFYYGLSKNQAKVLMNQNINNFYYLACLHILCLLFYYITLPHNLNKLLEQTLKIGDPIFLSNEKQVLFISLYYPSDNGSNRFGSKMFRQMWVNNNRITTIQLKTSMATEGMGSLEI